MVKHVPNGIRFSLLVLTGEFEATDDDKTPGKHYLLLLLFPYILYLPYLLKLRLLLTLHTLHTILFKRQVC